MPSTLQKLAKKQLVLGIPSFLTEAIQFETIGGSIAYACNTNTSDFDMLSFCIPPKDDIFEHLRGRVPQFDKPNSGFSTWVKHGVHDPTAQGGAGRTYDLTVHSIMKYFRLCADGNPTILDALFVPLRCITFATPIGEVVREKRHLFLSKKVWHTHKGYAYMQLHNLNTKQPTGKRKDIVEKYGMDVKSATHVVRLMLQVEQILTEGDLDLERNKDILQSIRRGEWSCQKIENFFQDKEKSLEGIYENSKLPWEPNTEKIRNLLIDCLEEHFGTLTSCIVRSDAASRAFREMELIMERYKGQI